MTRLSEIKGLPITQETGLGALTLPGFIEEVCARYPSREALCWDDEDGTTHRWSYQDLHTESYRVAKALAVHGVGKNSRVGILASNRPEWLFTLFGASLAGAVVVALNTFSTRGELQHQLTLADVEVLIFESQVASQNFVDHLEHLCPSMVSGKGSSSYSCDFPFLRTLVCLEKRDKNGAIQDWDNFLASGVHIPDGLIQQRGQRTTPQEDSLIFFSSGSTSLPKGVRQTHRAATLQCWRIGKLYNLTPEARTWNANGYFFSGNFALAFGTLSRGGCLVLLNYFQEDKAIALIEREKVSCVILWPHQETRMAQSPLWTTADFSAVYWVIFNSLFRHHPSVKSTWPGLNGYGMTETFTFVTAISGQAAASTTQGEVWPGNTLRIIDPETQQIVPWGETGEILVKGPTLMPGYLGVDSETVFDDEGFLHTADAGFFTSEGYLVWKGRLGDTIKTGGANVSPTEIDQVLSQHPSVTLCNTVGIADEQLGEIVVACVVLARGQTVTENELQRFCRERLSAYKVPRKILFFNKEEIPMTGSNKVVKSQLKTMALLRLDPVQV